jgi:hypothetical protein
MIIISQERFAPSKAKRALMDVPGLALLEPTYGKALTASELRRKRAELEMVVAELSRHSYGDIVMAAEDACARAAISGIRRQRAAGPAV